MAEKPTTKDARKEMGETRKSIKRRPKPKLVNPRRVAAAAERGGPMSIEDVKAQVGMEPMEGEEGYREGEGQMDEEAINEAEINANAERLEREMHTGLPPAEASRQGHKGRKGKGDRPATEPTGPGDEETEGRHHMSGEEKDEEARKRSKHVPLGGFDGDKDNSPEAKAKRLKDEQKHKR